LEIYVLRLGHRPKRDKRISTHVALTARAFGACGIYFDVNDEKLFESINDVCKRWGKNNGRCEFFIKTCNWRNMLKNFDGLKIHLTMYGMPLNEKLYEVKKHKKILVIVGAEKVPSEVYQLSDLNISIGNQPHSEVAALAIFLDRVLDEEEFKINFLDAKIQVKPTEKGKKLIKLQNSPQD